MEIYRGDIFEYEVKGEARRALIVSANFRNGGRYLSVIILTDEPKGNVNVPITCIDGMYYADCGMVAFAQSDRFMDFLKTATDEEMAQIDEGIAKCLGMEQKVVEVPVEQEVIKPIAEVTLDSEMASEIGELNKLLCEANAKAEIFENLYKELLSNVIKG